MIKNHEQQRQQQDDTQRSGVSTRIGHFVWGIEELLVTLFY
jgi:hypothetical protein